MAKLWIPQAPLTTWSWITMQGADAEDFLQRMTTTNVRALAVGQGASGCFLSPQGKFRAVFTLWHYAEAEFGFELDAGSTGDWKSNLLTTIDQFTFAEKFTITDVTTLASRWIFPENSEDLLALGAGALQPGETLAIDEEVRLCHHGDIDFGRPWISVWARPARLAQWCEQAMPFAQAMTWDELERFRILAVRPRADREITDDVNPLEVGMKDAVAPNKGCYPGQEVIEKIAALGAPARRLARVDGRGPAPLLGEKIFNSADVPVEIGIITSVTVTESGFSALALVRKIHAKEDFPVRMTSGAEATIARVSAYA